MTPVPPDHRDQEHAEPDVNSGSVGAGTDQPGGRNPRATSNPTGEKQAAENVENEPAG